MFTQGEKLRFQADAPARRVSRFFLKGRYAPGFILRGAARPTDALGNEPFVSCVGREQGHSRGRAGALLTRM